MNDDALLLFAGLFLFLSFTEKCIVFLVGNVLDIAGCVAGELLKLGSGSDTLDFDLRRETDILGACRDLDFVYTCLCFQPFLSTS